MLVLKQGFPGNHLTGTAPVSGVYIKFQNGVVDVKEQSLIDLMLRHPGFNTDYIVVEEEKADPFDYLRNQTEPSHVLTEIKYGHVEKSVGNKNPIKLSPEIKNMLHEEAVRMAKEMLPSMMKEVLKEMTNGTNPTSTKEEVSDGKEEGTLIDLEKEEIAFEKEIKEPFCPECSSKGVRHLKDCPKFK